MNIIIFDNENKCHNWEDNKQFLGQFVLKKDFFAGCDKDRQDYIERYVARINSKKNSYECADVHNSSEMENIVFTPSNSYGLVLIDFPGKKIFSMQEYDSAQRLLYMTIDLLFSSNYEIYGVDKKDILKDYLYLLEQQIYISDDCAINDGTIQNIKTYLNVANNEEKLKEFLKQYKNPQSTFLFHSFDLNKKSGWRVYESQGYADKKVSAAIVKLLAKKEIRLSGAQEKDWRDFFISTVQKEEDDDRVINTDFFNRPYIEMDKKKLEKQIGLVKTQVKNNNSGRGKRAKI